MNKHTLGPWYWHDPSNLHGGRLEDSVIFCTVEYDDGHYSELHCTPEDRSLIAAAPDLLAALKACLPAARDFVGRSAQPLLYRRTVVDLAEAAIAKAQGEDGEANG